MHTVRAALATSLFTLKGLVSAAELTLNNFCLQPLFYAKSNQTVPYPPPLPLTTMNSQTWPLVGLGEFLGISASAQYYAQDEPKMVVGTSISNGRLWWTLNNMSGDPLAGLPFSVTTPGDTNCGDSTAYGTNVYNCPDGDFPLTVNLCSL